MPWVRFTEDFWFRPRPSVKIRYRANHTYSVVTKCAQEAVAAKKAKRTSRPGQKEQPE